MRPSAIASAVFLATQGALVSPALAQAASETERLLKVIETQQRRLDDQEAQLAEQRKALQELRRQVEGLQSQRAPAAQAAAAPAGGATPPSTPGPVGAQAASAPARQDWPGSFEVSGTDTRVKISGYAELDVTHDNDAILTPSAFVTKAIVTRDGTAAPGADGQTNFSVQASRLVLETRTPVSGHRLSTYFGVDFFNDFGSTNPQLRLRQAYGEISDILFGGSLLIGQDWSTYASGYAIPATLEFQGPNAILGTRHPMVRWTKPLGTGLGLKLAVEAPDLRNFEGANSASRWPDGVAALTWDSAALHLQGSLLARDLRASSPTGSVASDFGWAASLAGLVSMPGPLKRDSAQFSLTYGDGYGGVLNDAPPDATYDATTNTLKAIQTWAWLAGYQHWWNPTLYSLATYGQIKQDNLDFQSAAAYRKTQYGSLNLTWVPNAQWLFGVEAVYGSREDKDGEKGSVVRGVFTGRLSF